MAEKNRKTIHRFMLNLRPELYEWLRMQAFNEKTSMSQKINVFIEQAKSGKKAKS